MPVMDNKKIPSAEILEQVSEKTLQNMRENNDFAKEFSKYIEHKLNPSDILKIGTTPYALQISGAKSLPLNITQTTIENTMNPETVHIHGHTSGHDISAETIKKLPSLIRKPIMVLQDKNSPNLTAILDEKDKQGRNIICRVVLDKKEAQYTVNRISSMYGKRELAEFLTKAFGEQRVVSMHKEKADELLHSIGCQSSKENSIISFDDSIAYTTANVKYPSNTITAEKQAESNKIKEYKFTNTALAATADKLKEKIATLEDKNTALSAKISKNEKKIEKRQAKIEDAQKTKAYCKTLIETTALPQPLAAFFQSMEKRNAGKAERLSEKIKTTQSKNKELSAKIKKNTVKIEKNNKKIDTLEKVDKFLNNMHTKEGRKENFITGLQKFRIALLEKKQLKNLKLDNKISETELSLTKLSSALDKVKLRNKIAKYKAVKDKLNSQIKKLEDMRSKLDNIANISDSNADKVISAASENITSALNENKNINPNKVVDTVITKTDKILDEIDRIVDRSIDNINRSEKDNPLKNTEILIEDNYNNIDGVINNVSSNDPKNIEKQNSKTQKSDKGILSRNIIQKNANIIHNRQPEKYAPTQNKNQSIE